jgi:hypothetical protein
LTQFLTDLVDTDYWNVLSQYGVGHGRGYGVFIQASFLNNVAANLSDSDVHNIIQASINAGAIPEPPEDDQNVLLIFLDENTAINDPEHGIVMCERANDTEFGYHSNFTTAAGHDFYYAVIPALDDTCLRNSCLRDVECSLHLFQSQEQRRTQVTSHELIEMCTDPVPPTGWWSPRHLQNENGDICNGEADTITKGANTWTVQRQYSRYDDINSNGAVFCITTAPNPIPGLSPGPSGPTAGGIASAQCTGLYKAFLPLPTAHYDVKSKKFSLDEDHVRRYMRSVFYPRAPENVFADFPGALHSIADILEKAPRKGKT